eukprot:Amastigsp_a509385_45.p2 type:complete len:367 gc:universal Amastigsp_a509385_45:785-1885(+)
MRAADGVCLRDVPRVLLADALLDSAPAPLWQARAQSAAHRRRIHSILGADPAARGAHHRALARALLRRRSARAPRTRGVAEGVFPLLHSRDRVARSAAAHRAVSPRRARGHRAPVGLDHDVEGRSALVRVPSGAHRAEAVRRVPSLRVHADGVDAPRQRVAVAEHPPLCPMVQRRGAPRLERCARVRRRRRTRGRRRQLHPHGQVPLRVARLQRVPGAHHRAHLDRALPAPAHVGPGPRQAVQVLRGHHGGALALAQRHRRPRLAQAAAGPVHRARCPVPRLLPHRHVVHRRGQPSGPEARNQPQAPPPAVSDHGRDRELSVAPALPGPQGRRRVRRDGGVHRVDGAQRRSLVDNRQRPLGALARD